MEYWLPLIFMGLMALAILVYVLLDGFDLGVGILLQAADEDEKDTMIASIGPFWDANETWLVLGIGILLIAFPLAHGTILTALYLPVALMLGGLILRGVAFDFRVKARDPHKPAWNFAFFAGSLLASFAQGLMLGYYIGGFDDSAAAHAFAVLIGVCLVAGYVLLGAGWLILRCEHGLQQKAVHWARRALWLTGVGILAVSVATPLVSQRIFERWFSLPEFLLLSPIPLLSLALFGACLISLSRLRRDGGRGSWVPFVCAAGLFLLAFLGLAYSLFPYLVVGELTLWDAASSTKSLAFILWGVGLTLPAILGYTIFSYRVFWGKATPLSYG